MVINGSAVQYRKFSSQSNAFLPANRFGDQSQLEAIVRESRRIGDQALGALIESQGKLRRSDFLMVEPTFITNAR
jgi:hypothetical protein